MASTLTNYLRVRDLYEKLLSLGHNITCDWTPFVDDIGKELPDVILQERAMAEMNGVLECDTLILVEPAHRGSYTEFGIALANNIPVYHLRDQQDSAARKVSFHYLQGVTVFNTEYELFQALANRIN